MMIHLFLCCRETASTNHHRSSGFDEQKQPLTSKHMQQSSVAAASNNTQQAVAPSVAVPPPAPHSAVELPTLPPSAANATTLFSANPCNTVMTSCAGCVQQQFQCNQIQCPGVSTDAMEMTAALLHSQPPLQLVSCHGPIMHPATPSNQRYNTVYDSVTNLIVLHPSMLEPKKCLSEVNY